MTVRKAIIPAAGLGTRFLPATKASPKEIIPLVDKPVIQYVVEEAVAAGIEEIILVTARGKQALEDHFDRAPELEAILEARGKRDELGEVRRLAEFVTLIAVRQKQALGLGHAVLVAKDLVGDEPFAVLLGDDIIDPAPGHASGLGQLIALFEQRREPIIALQEVPDDELRHYGVIRGEPLGDDLWRIHDLVEKPEPALAPSRLAVIGRYVLPPEIFSILEETRFDAHGEIQLTEGLRSLARLRPLNGYCVHGRRYDAGSKLGYLIATVELGLKHPQLGAPFRAYLEAHLKAGGKGR